MGQTGEEQRFEGRLTNSAVVARDPRKTILNTRNGNMALNGAASSIARRNFLNRLLLVVDLQRRNNRVRRDEIGERHDLSSEREINDIS